VLNLLVVRSHTEPDQSIGRRQPIVQVDVYYEARLPEEMLRRVEAGRAGADHGDSQRMLLDARTRHGQEPTPAPRPGGLGRDVRFAARPASAACPPRRGTGRAPL